MTNPGHALHHSLMMLKSAGFNLRSLAHNFELTFKDNRHFMARQLYSDIYCAIQSWAPAVVTYSCSYLSFLFYSFLINCCMVPAAAVSMGLKSIWFYSLNDIACLIDDSVVISFYCRLTHGDLIDIIIILLFSGIFIWVLF